ncbi:MAG: glycerol kinase GlpK [Clostridia bacterium]|jgi:glycerol kinase|nr:glycerol kinase GlpK [Clostridia bacterium]MDD3232185.1 glycerol kinase GlpK [Clostridia bacterium]MDD4408437.1 glycerol kinase GlpK [Clostridia bacterium]
MKKYILAIDEGTTSCRAGLFDVKKNVFTCVKSAKFKLNFPKNAWVEFDANEVWKAQKKVLLEVGENVEAKEIYGIGITNQRESVVAWDRQTGIAVYPAICWQCRRTADFCNKLSAEKKELIKQKTGLIVDPYFSATKFQWLFDNVPEIKNLAKQNRLCFGTIDSFLVFKMTGGAVFATDTTNASRTMLFNLKTLDWDNELLSFFNLERKWLPKIMSSSEIYGETFVPNKVRKNDSKKSSESENNSDYGVFDFPLKICSVIGDQQSALVGQCCFEKGMVKNTYGTGCFALINTGSEIRNCKKLITTVAYTIAGKTTYAIEGSAFNAGSLVEWLISIGLINSASETENLALDVDDNGGVYLVPAFTGLGAPYWDSNARGAFLGLTRGTTKNHLVRAVLESMAFSTYDLFSTLKASDGEYIKELRVDGGVAKNNFVMQFQSDLLGLKVKLPKDFESTLLGATFLAGLSSGAYSNLKEISTKWQIQKEFTPKMNDDERQKLLDGWHKSVNMIIRKD